MSMDLGPQFSPTQAADRRSRRRNLGPVSVGANERGLTEQLPELADAAKAQHGSTYPDDRRKFAEKVARGERLPQHPLETKAFNDLNKQLSAALGRSATKTDMKLHMEVSTHAELRAAIRRHVGLE